MSMPGSGSSLENRLFAKTIQTAISRDDTKAPSGLKKPSLRNLQATVRRPTTGIQAVAETGSGKHRLATPKKFALAGKNPSSSMSALGKKDKGTSFANLMKTRPSTAFGHASKDTSAATAAAAKAAAKTVASFRRKEVSKSGDRGPIKKGKMPTQSSKFNDPPPGAASRRPASSKGHKSKQTSNPVSRGNAARKAMYRQPNSKIERGNFHSPVDPIVAKMARLEADRQLRRQKNKDFKAKRQNDMRRNEKMGRPGDIDFQRMIDEYLANEAGRPRPYVSVLRSHSEIASDADDSSSMSNICVCVRTRPVNDKEKRLKLHQMVSCINPRVIVHECKLRVDGIHKYLENSQFEFDLTFGPYTPNRDVYIHSVRPLVKHIFERGNATCFAFGQTGSGKTYTMQAMQKSAIKEVIELFNQSTFSKNGCALQMSFFEICGMRCFDLLNQRRKGEVLQICEDGKGKVHAKGLSFHPVDDMDNCLNAIAIGNRRRKTHKTEVHADSSRSHAIFQLHLVGRNKTELGRLSLCDLAGSERGSETKQHNQARRQEGAEINKSLLALKECIRAIDSGKTHIPYRASKLTMVLKSSFSSKSRCTIISCVSPTVQAQNHTLNTLRYVDRIKSKTVSAPNFGQTVELKLATNASPLSETANQLRKVARLSAAGMISPREKTEMKHNIFRSSTSGDIAISDRPQVKAPVDSNSTHLRQSRDSMASDSSSSSTPASGHSFSTSPINVADIFTPTVLSGSGPKFNVGSVPQVAQLDSGFKHGATGVSASKTGPRKGAAPIAEAQKPVPTVKPLPKKPATATEPDSKIPDGFEQGATVVSVSKTGRRRGQYGTLVGNLDQKTNKWMVRWALDEAQVPYDIAKLKFVAEESEEMPDQTEEEKIPEPEVNAKPSPDSTPSEEPFVKPESVESKSEPEPEPQPGPEHESEPKQEPAESDNHEPEPEPEAEPEEDLPEMQHLLQAQAVLTQKQQRLAAMHTRHVQEHAMLVEIEGELLQEVATGCDASEYASRLQDILDKKQELIDELNLMVRSIQGAAAEQKMAAKKLRQKLQT